MNTRNVFKYTGFGLLGIGGLILIHLRGDVALELAGARVVQRTATGLLADPRTAGPLKDPFFGDRRRPQQIVPQAPLPVALRRLTIRGARAAGGRGTRKR